jgi:hypothetical protein
MCDMLVSVLLKLAGPRSLDLRVDNPERYHFRPEKMLQEIITIFLHFAPHPLFSNAVANSGFYQNGGKDLFAKVKSDHDVSCTLFVFHSSFHFLSAVLFLDPFAFHHLKHASLQTLRIMERRKFLGEKHQLQVGGFVCMHGTVYPHFVRPILHGLLFFFLCSLALMSLSLSLSNPLKKCQITHLFLPITF